MFLHSCRVTSVMRLWLGFGLLDAIVALLNNNNIQRSFVIEQGEVIISHCRALYCVWNTVSLWILCYQEVIDKLEGVWGRTSKITRKLDEMTYEGR